MPTLHIDLSKKDLKVLQALRDREYSDLEISQEPAYRASVGVLDYILDNVRDH